MKSLNVDSSSILYGIMVWWNECEEATRYKVELYLNKNSSLQRLAVETVDNNHFYYTFTGLAAQDYTIEVVAENSVGETVAQGTCSCKVSDFITKTTKPQVDTTFW